MALALLFASVLLHSVGQLLQKQRVAARAAEHPLGAGGRGFAGLLARLARDPLWLASHLCDGLGALVGLQAIAALDLVVLKSLGRTGTLFVVLGGAWLLRERLTPREWRGVALVLLGSTLLCVAGGGASSGVASPRAAIAFYGACAAALAALLALQRWRPRVLRAETALGLGAGLLFGAGDVLVKDVTGAIGSSFSVLDPGSLAELARAPEFALAFAGYLLGFVLLQGAYAVGRASVIAPLQAFGNSLLPIGFGAIALGEDLGPERLAAVAVLFAGSALLARRATTQSKLARPVYSPAGGPK